MSGTDLDEKPKNEVTVYPSYCMITNSLYFKNVRMGFSRFLKTYTWVT